jgi:hypothetical protein
MSTSRREFCKQVNGVALGAIAGVVGAELLPPAAASPAGPPLPWEYARLEPEAVARRAYEATPDGACMYATFVGIIGGLAQKVGAPYSTFPSGMMKYGANGIAGWGLVCGALNGAAAAIYLVHDPATGAPVINELFRWYAEQPLPLWRPAKPRIQDAIAPSVAGSQLCHISVARWCDKSAYKANSPQRGERCARLAASVAHRTVELLNAAAGSETVAGRANPPEVRKCLACHGKGGSVGNVYMSSQSSCTICHTSLSRHPVPIK